jgi:hypothetical protein
MEQHTYHLGQTSAGRRVLRWEDLDDDTQTDISHSVVAELDRVLALIRPMAESIESSMATWERVVDWVSRSTPVFESIVQIADSLRRWVPNWPKGLNAERAWDVTGTGIALAFVPRPAITAELVAANDHTERIAIITSSKALILQDCREALELDDGDSYPDALAMLVPLLREAFDVLDSGYAAAACALGVCAIDSALRRTQRKKLAYPDFRNEITAADLHETLQQNNLRVLLALRPLHSLFEGWWPSLGVPPPSMPSRHFIAHWADPAHLTEANATLILMAETSVIRGLAEREIFAGLRGSVAS